MVEQEMDRILEDQITRLIGISSHRLSLPLDLVSIACLFLMHDREKRIQERPETKAERFNGDTFLTELTQTGIPADGLSIKKFNILLQEGYFSADAEECYTAEPPTHILAGLLNRIFPGMQGVFFCLLLYSDHRGGPVREENEGAGTGTGRPDACFPGKGIESGLPFACREKVF